MASQTKLSPEDLAAHCANLKREIAIRQERIRFAQEEIAALQKDAGKDPAKQKAIASHAATLKTRAENCEKEIDVMAGELKKLEAASDAPVNPVNPVNEVPPA